MYREMSYDLGNRSYDVVPIRLIVNKHLFYILRSKMTIILIIEVFTINIVVLYTAD